jgi:hypothetical protein
MKSDPRKSGRQSGTDRGSILNKNLARSKPPLLGALSGRGAILNKKLAYQHPTSISIHKSHTFCAPTSAIFSHYNIVEAATPAHVRFSMRKPDVANSLYGTRVPILLFKTIHQSTFEELLVFKLLSFLPLPSSLQPKNLGVLWGA